MKLESEMIRDFNLKKEKRKKCTLGGLISILKWTFVIKAKLSDLSFVCSL